MPIRGLSIGIISNIVSKINVYLPDKDVIINNLLTDSRSLNSQMDTLFFAISTETGDGHKYIDSLVSSGVCSFILSKDIEPYISMYPNCNWIQVRDSVEALQQIAIYCRENSPFINVVGITGSYGKTITKDIMVALLNGFDIFYSPHSYNSQIGVPLSVFSACQEALSTPRGATAIFEAGISKVGEMFRLEKIIKPNIGIFTSVGDAHSEGFADMEEKVREKLSLFSNSNYIVVGDNAPLVVDIIRSSDNLKEKLLYWSFDRDANADYYIDKKTIADNCTKITLYTKEDRWEFVLPFTDDSYLVDTINAIIAIRCINKNIDIESLAYGSLKYLNMRIEVKSAINANTIIYDRYSFDLHSLKLSLDFLHRRSLNSGRSSVLILSDIGKSVSIEEQARDINKLISGYNISTLIIIGVELIKCLECFSVKNVYCFRNTEQLLKNKLLDEIYNSCILIKGAREFSFENIVSYLSPKQHPTALEVNLKSIRDNVIYYRSCLPKNHKIIGMIKADGYGLGAFEVALTLQEIGIDYLAVALVDEAIDLRDRGISCPIIVMNPEESSFNNLFDYNLEPEIYSFDILYKINEVAKERGTQLNIHIKIDTGMHRLGFMPDQVEGLGDFLTSNKLLKVNSIFSHLASSDDDKELGFVYEQCDLFDKYSEVLISKIGYKPYRHILNTAGIERLGKTKYSYEMARLGIGIYGVNPNGLNNLKQVARLRTTVLQIKKLQKGENIGYSHKNFVPKDSIIAVIPIGYADGFRRCLGNGAYCLDINGKQIQTIGNVCMDTTMVDITSYPEIKEGDTVFVFGSPITPIADLAKSLNTIEYEVLTSVGHRVRREYIFDDSF